MPTALVLFACFFLLARAFLNLPVAARYLVDNIQISPKLKGFLPYLVVKSAHLAEIVWKTAQTAALRGFRATRLSANLSWPA
jgi:hypothetical protein